MTTRQELFNAEVAQSLRRVADRLEAGDLQAQQYRQRVSVENYERSEEIELTGYPLKADDHG
jgi:hypothetical protein